MTGEIGSCAHMRVVYVTEFESSGLTKGWWECDSCRHPFAPDAHVAALEEQNKNLQQTLGLYRGPHVTMTVSYAEELENTRDQLIAKDALVGRLVEALRRLGSMQAFSNPKWIVRDQDAELIARIDYAQKLLAHLDATR